MKRLTFALLALSVAMIPVIIRRMKCKTVAVETDNARRYDIDEYLASDQL